MPCQNTETARERLRTLHTVYGMRWHEIAALPEYSGIPPGTLSGIVSRGYIPPKWYRKLGLTRKRLRIVAQVSEAEYNAVKVAAEREGVTMAEYIRRVLRLEEGR